MGKGKLQVQLFVGDQVLPVSDATVLVKDKNGNVVYRLTTDKNGHTEAVTLDAPDKNHSLDPNDKAAYFSAYDVEVPRLKGYKKVEIHNTQVFDTVTSILPIQMYPALEAEDTTDITIPYEHGVDYPRDTPADLPEYPFVATPAANEVAIPEYITVHLGSPNADARNVRVPFKDYVKVIYC